MTPDIALTLAVAAGALALFVWNRLPVDVVGLLVMVTLIVLGLVTPQEGISGFANEATVTVAAMLVLSTGMLRTGAVDVLARWVARLAEGSEFRLLAVVLAIVVPVSALINNTAAVAIMLPMLLGLAREMEIAPSRLLMPLSFGGQMGGTLTLIGTSTNLLVAGLVLDLGLDRIRLFDITPPALVLTAAGLVYLVTLGRWLTPTREAPTDLLQGYELRDYLTGLVVEEGSPLLGRSLAECRFGEEYGLQVLEIRRGEECLYSPGGGAVLHVGDLLLVRGKPQEIVEIGERDGLRITGTQPEMMLADADRQEDEDGPVLAEGIVPPRSRVVGSSVRRLNFRARYGVTVLAVQRHDEPLQEPLGDIAFKAGDTLLLQGSADRLQELHKMGDISLLGPVQVPRKRRRKIGIAVLIMALVVLLPALEATTILVSSLAGAAAMFVTGCITPEEAYEEVDWMVIILLGSILPLGIAMQQTGTAAFLTQQLLEVTAALGPHGVLAALYLLTTLLTAVISNNAAAVVLTPIAVSTGVALEMSPLPLVIAVMLAASNSFVTPIGYQTNTFIYGPGGYRFSDFIRVGGPLNLLLLALATLVIPLFFPFHAH